MSKKATIPDAWDDDWESQADQADAVAIQLTAVEEEAKTTKAERLAKHAEVNKKIWASAEEPETFHFLAANDNVPLKSEFKPALKVLSRKPTPRMIERIDPVTGLKTLISDGEEDRLEAKVQLAPEQMRLKAQKERDEKQRRYNEARARILGTTSGSSTVGSTTQPSEGSKPNRGNGNGRGRGNSRIDHQRPLNESGNRELFDPNYSPKSGAAFQKWRGESPRPAEDNTIIRPPRGPDVGGHAGFGFARRRGKSS